jgi:hypothetical protein
MRAQAARTETERRTRDKFTRTVTALSASTNILRPCLFGRTVESAIFLLWIGLPAHRQNRSSRVRTASLNDCQ